jgi:hypothetical protein
MIALGIVTAGSYPLAVVGQLLGMDPFLGYLLPIFAAPVCGLILIVWGAFGLLRKKPHA